LAWPGPVGVPEPVAVAVALPLATPFVGNVHGIGGLGADAIRRLVVDTARARIGPETGRSLGDPEAEGGVLLA
jgi:hypothetical protein